MKESKTIVTIGVPNFNIKPNNPLKLFRDRLEEDLSNYKCKTYVISNYRVLQPDIKDGKQKRRERRIQKRLNK